MINYSFFEERNKEGYVHSFSRSLRENEPKEGRYPQGPLDRGMQTEDSCVPAVASEQSSSGRNRQSSVGFGIAGHAMSFYIYT